MKSLIINWSSFLAVLWFWKFIKFPHLWNKSLSLCWAFCFSIPYNNSHIYNNTTDAKPVRYSKIPESLFVQYILYDYPLIKMIKKKYPPNVADKDSKIRICMILPFKYLFVLLILSPLAYLNILIISII